MKRSSQNDRSHNLIGSSGLVLLLAILAALGVVVDSICDYLDQQCGVVEILSLEGFE